MFLSTGKITFTFLFTAAECGEKENERQQCEHDIMNFDKNNVIETWRVAII